MELETIFQYQGGIIMTIYSENSLMIINSNEGNPVAMDVWVG